MSNAPYKIDFSRILASCGIEPVKSKFEYQPGQRIWFPKLLDTHGHARDPEEDPAEMLNQRGAQSRIRTALITTLPFCDSQIWMPNLRKAIESAEELEAYHRELVRISNLVNPEAAKTFKHHIALKLTKKTTKAMLKAVAEVMKRLGLIKVVKNYPLGVTTNATEGWSDIEEMYEPIDACMELGYTVDLHGEQPDGKEPHEQVFTMQRERVFIENVFDKLMKRFRGGRFSLEHMSTKEALLAVLGEKSELVTGGVTPQHILMTLNDVLECKEGGGHPGLNPHNYCRPPAQTLDDVKVLLEAVLNASRYTKIRLGSDSALHQEHTKECACGCAGVFSAPVLAIVVAAIFHAAGKLNGPDYEAFVRGNALKFYGPDFAPTGETRKFALDFKPWVVPASYGKIVPMYAGCELPFCPTDECILQGVA
jgi:dihydroorotase